MAAPQSPVSMRSSPILPGRTRRRIRPFKLEFNLNSSPVGCDLPTDMTPLESQVGGHAFGDKNDIIGDYHCIYISMMRDYDYTCIIHYTLIFVSLRNAEEQKRTGL